MQDLSPFFIMTTIQAIILGMVQGLTEFLPVSSSGHLVLANYHFGFNFGNGASLPLYVDLATNTGTFFAALVALRTDVWQALSGFLQGLTSADARQKDGWRMAILVIIGSVPTLIIALLLRPIFEDLNRPLFVSFMLIITGIIMWFTYKSGPKDNVAKLTWKDALIGGIAQGIAIIPGISRSGSTIATMLWRGASAEVAAKFSFLMYLVASFGAAILSIIELRDSQIDLAPVLGMIIASFVVGYIAIVWLFAILRRGQFKWFGPYLWIVATITLLRLLVF